MHPAHLHRVQGNGARLILDVNDVLKQIRTAVMLRVSFMCVLHAIHRSWCLGWGLTVGGKKNCKSKQAPENLRYSLYLVVFDHTKQTEK